MRAWISIYLKGLAMGAADIIPGVSGGTIALIVGIYDRLVTAIASLDPRVVTHLRRPTDPTARSAFFAELIDMDLPFLLVLGAGIGTAFLGISRVILIVFQAYPAAVNAFFFGLIAASAFVIYRDVSIDTPGRFVVSFIGFTLAFVVAGLAATGTDGSLPVVLVAGAIAISAMVLPGISGAAFLYLLGQYEFLLDALRGTVDGLIALVTGGSAGEFAESSIVVGTFLVGAVVGLLTTAHAVAFALSRYRIATLAFLTSLMVGALRLPLEEIHSELGIPGAIELAWLAGVALIGVLAVVALDRATGSLEYV